jgi:hypothetical protein
MAEDSAWAGINLNEVLPHHTQEEKAAQRRVVIKLVQSEGLPDLVERCRSGDDATKERAAAILSFIAANDMQCKSAIVSAGGLPPLIAMLTAEDGAGEELDDDGDGATSNFDMKEQAVKTIFDLCEGCPSNQRPVADRGAIPPLIKIVADEIEQEGSSKGVPWSIKEAAVETLAVLAMEVAGGLAQELIHSEGGITKLLEVARHPYCPPKTKESVARALRNLATCAARRGVQPTRRRLLPVPPHPTPPQPPLLALPHRRARAQCKPAAAV